MIPKTIFDHFIKFDKLESVVYFCIFENQLNEMK
jgi:hypothetical protein